MSSKKSTLNRSVAYSSFEHLHFAMVQFVIGESKHKNSTETCHAIIENMGFIAGQKSAERMTSNKPRFGDDHLDLIKVLCKEFWNDWFGAYIHLFKNDTCVGVSEDACFFLWHTLVFFSITQFLLPYNEQHRRINTF